MEKSGPLAELFAAYRAGHLTRRQFMQSALSLGIGMPVVLLLVNSGGAAAAPTSPGGAPTFRPQTGPNGGKAVGTAQQKRGEGGELKILQWQAPTLLNGQQASGIKDQLACMMFAEPLFCYLPDGSYGPVLVEEIPTKQNGQLASDLSAVTYKLRPGVTWSDGQPFSADDVVFTWKWIMDEANQSVNYAVYQPIKSVDKIDDHTVKVSYGQPRPDWYVPFSSYPIGNILPQHILAKGKSAADDFRNAHPVGTGPYMVESFKAGDQLTAVPNPHYREPNKPYFSHVNLKGGGDAPSAARAVLQTGDWDYAWNMQVEPEVLKSMEAAGKGKVLASTGAGPEIVYFNFSDPTKEVDGQRSYWKQPHPFFSDKAVRQAFSLACDRNKIADSFYLPPDEHATANIMNIPMYISKDTSFTFDLDQAKKVLDEAGWVMKDGVRQKNGVRIEVTYSTSINSVRQKEQALNKANWEKVGFKVQLRQVDAGIYFDTSAGNDQSIYHFYDDVQMYTSNPATPYPITYLDAWWSNNGQNIAQRENGWSQVNTSRYNNPAYDHLRDRASTETDAEKFVQLVIQMNDTLINDYAIVPLVLRANVKAAVGNKLNAENIDPGPIEFDYWNIANWNAAKS